MPEALGLSFHTSAQLNALIDKSLPGRPRFQRHEIEIGGEVCEVYFRNVIQCVKAIYEDPTFAAYMVYAPERHYTNETMKTCMYHDMHTGKWWWKTQVSVFACYGCHQQLTSVSHVIQKEIEKDKPGATIIPIIISTDKTQLTDFRNKSAYPVYLTIGNIPKEIRRKPSARAYVLLGYLPTTRLEGVINAASRRRQLTNLYHACMRRIFEPLESVGRDGVMWASGDGAVRRCHPIFSCFVGDYPEQVLVTGTYTGQCAACKTPHSEFGEWLNRDADVSFRDLDEVLDVLDSFDEDPGGFLQACKSVGVKPVVHPFWIDLPYAHIFRSITPDILHQMYQGVAKHTIRWVIAAGGAAEIDARCRRLPPNHNIRHFAKGISCLSRISGMEHEQMCRILLGLVIDLPLPGGASNVRLIRCVRALLDFLFLAQLPVHTTDSLNLLDEALHSFHDNKGIFITLGIRTNFNLPKLHFASHYVEMISFYGTTDNFNTEYTERLHIDFAKQAYSATNRKDEFTQMTIWLERKEKILRHAQFVAWRLAGSPAPMAVAWSPPGLELDRALHMAKHPTLRGETIERIERSYGATHFRNALARYVVLLRNPGIKRWQEVEKLIWTVHLPTTRLPVWRRIKFLRTDPFTGISTTSDSIHVEPEHTNGKGSTIPARFDTAWIDVDGRRLAGRQEAGPEGYRVGRVRVVFTIPERFRNAFFGQLPEGTSIPEHLAYIEWFSPLRQHREANHKLFSVSAMRDEQGTHLHASIIPVTDIRRSVLLFPKFGGPAPVGWTSSTVLDVCRNFFVDDFTDRHMYRIMG